MNIKNIVSLFVIAITLLVVVPAVSAFANINYVESEGLNLQQGTIFGVEAGQTLDLRVVFDSATFENNVRVTARVLGVPGTSDTTERFDVLPSRIYSKLLRLDIPSDIDPNEDFILEVKVESQDSVGATFTATFAVQRKNYALEFLSIQSDSRVSAGEVLQIEAVLKNRGRYIAEDTFIEASIPTLGISKRIFLQDLTPLDNSSRDIKDDSIEGRMLLAVPANAAPGLYTVEIKAFNNDAETTAIRRVEIVSSNANSMIVPSSSSKTFSAGSEGKYTLTIVNSGNKILVYNLVTESDDGLTVSLEDSVVVVPAGSSKSIILMANSNREGKYDFKVTVLGADNAVVSEKDFVANVEGRAVSGNAAVVLTIVLAIVFIVLLVVLIVLLTRKPAKADESSESYY
ncbi:hypothetical protein J4416_01810 [Candidatus Pacearchaeota archaeon]|nr:hypothetical protein [Candidatus Pacearchaeota archaeon]